MPFPRAQSPSNPINLHQKLGINSVCSDQSTREMKKVRVICSDPYATESSGDDETSEKPYVAKRIVRVVNIPLSFVNGPKDPESAVSGPKDPEIVSSCQNSNNGERAPQKKSNARTKTRKPNEPQLKGIRKRAPGSWASEIRDPITKKRVWLGTFKSPEEASMAYERKKLEFNEALASAAAAAPRGKRYTRSVSSVAVSRQTAVSGDSESLVSHTSPSSVLEIESSASASALVVNSRCNEKVKADESIDAEQKMHNSVGVDVDEALVSEIGKGLDLEMELESFIINDFDQSHLLDDFCSLDDLQIDGFDDNEPSDLPDFDFEIGDGLSWFDDTPINMVQP